MNPQTAEKSTQSTKEIADLIQSIQREARQASKYGTQYANRRRRPQLGQRPGGGVAQN